MSDPGNRFVHGQHRMEGGLNRQVAMALPLEMGIERALLGTLGNRARIAFCEEARTSPLCKDS